MGIEHPYEDEDPDVPEIYAAGQALEGEIVVYRPYPGSSYSYGDTRRQRQRPYNPGPDIGHGHHDEHGNPRRGDDSERPKDRYRRGEPFGPRSYDESLVRQVVAYRIAHPHVGDRKIGARFGVSHETVRKWTREDVDKRSAIVDTPKIRAEAAIHLEGARAEAWEIYQALKDRLGLDERSAEEGGAPDLPHPNYLKLLDTFLGRIEQITGTHAKLMGTNMPVKVDVQLTALTEAEKELQTMIDEARARTAAMEAAVIAEASADPDL